jgi:branched-chain amino acid transport system permease protein
VGIPNHNDDYLNSTARIFRGTRSFALRPSHLGKGIFVLLVLLPFLFVPFFVKNQFILQILTFSFIWLLLLSGLNITMGYVGRAAFTTAAMFGIGAYSSADFTLAGLNFWIALPLTGMFVGLIGFILGFPVLRTKAAYFVWVTILMQLVLGHAFITFPQYTGGIFGLSNIPRPNSLVIGNIVVSFESMQAMYFLGLGLVFVVTMGQFVLLRSRIGRAFVAIRENEDLADSMGLNTGLYKSLAYGLTCFVWGIAGSFYAAYITFVGQSAFGVALSFDMWTWLVVGGSGSFFGPFLGIAFFVPVTEFLVSAVQLRLLLEAVITLVVIMFRPQGIVSIVMPLARRLTSSSKPPVLDSTSSEETITK